ncbi:carbohydrate kinase family protein [Candidatus Bipolaricaulota bacterium]|nr:carbohydrate kinase family protein [Candidatus Bipolaricaulota bacterium]
MRERPVVALLGDLNVDVMVRVGAMPAPGGEAHAAACSALGGSAALTARWLAAAGCEVHLAAAVGEDPFGDWLLAALARDGVPTTWIQRARGDPTGLCLSLVQRGGERTLLASPGAARDLRWDRIPESWLGGASMLHVSGYAWLGGAERQAADRAVGLARERGIPVSLDPGAVAARLEETLGALAAFELILPNRREVRDLTGEPDPQRGARALRRRGVRWVAVKLDREGCAVHGPRGAVRVPPFPVEAGNATGAGDAFNAGAIVGVLSGWGPEEVGTLGNFLGAAAVRQGAGGPLPDRGELLALLPGGGTLGRWIEDHWRKEGR